MLYVKRKNQCQHLFVYQAYLSCLHVISHLILCVFSWIQTTKQNTVTPSLLSACPGIYQHHRQQTESAFQGSFLDMP